MRKFHLCRFIREYPPDTSGHRCVSLRFYSALLSLSVFVSVLLGLCACGRSEYLYSDHSDDFFKLNTATEKPAYYPNLPPNQHTEPATLPLLKGMPVVFEQQELRNLFFLACSDHEIAVESSEDGVGYSLSCGRKGRADVVSDGSLFFTNIVEAQDILSSVCDITCDPFSEERLSQYRYIGEHVSQERNLSFMSRDEAIAVSQDLIHRLRFNAVTANCIALDGVSFTARPCPGKEHLAEPTFLSEGVYVVDFFNIATDSNILIYSGTGVNPVNGRVSVGAYATVCVGKDGILALYISSNRNYIPINSSDDRILSKKEAFDVLENRLSHLIGIGDVEIIEQHLMYYTEQTEMDSVYKDGFTLTPVWFFVFRQRAAEQPKDDPKSAVVHYFMDAYTGELK